MVIRKLESFLTKETVGIKIDIFEMKSKEKIKWYVDSTFIFA
jgi:hypothetical protein